LRKQKPALIPGIATNSDQSVRIKKTAYELAQSIGSEQNTVSIWGKALYQGRFFKITPQSNRKKSIRSMSYKRGFEVLKI